jgi:hypothetical protein
MRFDDPVAADDRLRTPPGTTPSAPWPTAPSPERERTPGA